MASVTALPPIVPGATFRTLADVVHELGDVPIHRVLWNPYPGTATEDDVIALCRHKILTEMVDQILVVKAVDRDILQELLAEFVPGVETLADVIDRLGGIPLDRLLWHPASYPATEADVLRWVDGGPRRLVERIDGCLVEKAMGFRESLLAGWIITLLNNFVVPRRLGVVGAPDALMRVSDVQTRMPDACFKAWANLPDRELSPRPIADYAPDLAVEVLSERNTRREIDRKRQEYFDAGTQLVWIVDPRTLTVAVYTGPDAHTLLTAADTLDGGTVLPGFTVPVADIFAYLDPPPAAG